MTLYSRTLNRRRRYLLRPRPDSTIDGTGPPLPADQTDDFVFTTTATEVVDEPSVAPIDREFVARTASDTTELLPAHLNAEPLELVLTSPNETGIEPVRIDEATCLVGSGSQADLRLPHPDVSRNHALLHRDGERLLFGDLGSRTGLSRNGTRCDCGWLEPGDVLQVGPYSLHWHGHSASDDAASAQALSTPAPTTSVRRLRVTEGPIGLASEIPLDRPMTLIGRGSACGLRLRDKSVSRVHAAVLSLENGVCVVDLARRGEPLVNDRLEACIGLEAGDELRIGRFRIALLDASLPSTKADATTGLPTIVHERRQQVPADPAAALADLQRRFHEQSRRQLDLLGRVVDSVEGGLKDDVRREIEHLRQIVGGHENDSRQPPSQSISPEAIAKARRARAVRRAFGGRTAAKPHVRPTISSHQPVTPPSLPESTTDADVPTVDYGRIAQRIAVHQRRSRPGRWTWLLRLLF